jgi:hypothetical protein
MSTAISKDVNKTPLTIFVCFYAGLVLETSVGKVHILGSNYTQDIVTFWA